MSILDDARASENSIVLETPLPQPREVPKRLHCAGLAGVVSFGVAIGVYLMMVSFLTLGSVSPSISVRDSFTGWGQICYRPERDIPLYILGCTGTFLFCCLLTHLWNRRIASLSSQDAYSFIVSRSVYNLCLAAAASLVNLIWLALGHYIIIDSHIVPPLAAELLFMGVLAAGELVLFARTLYSSAPLRFPRAVRLLEARLRDDDAANNSRERAAPILAFQSRDLICLLLICFAIYIPHPEILAGNIFQNEHFHHWDYFVMAPAVGYLHGQALCTQVYSQYGIGWPLLFAELNPIYHLSYGHLIQFASLYGCVYFCGVYLFFRMLLQNRRWALGGVFTAIYYKLFCWPGAWLVSWQLPSLTLLRAPFDIWFLIALLLHQRTRHPRWLLVTGALTGLSILFETDTGIYIAFTFFIYSLFFLRGEWKQTGGRAGRRCAIQIGACWLLSALTLLAGMGIASRGTLLQGAFWRGWIECFTAYPSGFSMTPVAEVLENITYGMIIIGAYLFAMNYRFLRLLRFGASERNSPRACDLVLLCVALYGSCTMLHFIGRSNPHSLLAGALGFSILLVHSLYRLSRFLDQSKHRDDFILTRSRWAVPAVLTAMTVFCLSNTGTRHYPNLPHQLIRGAHPENIWMEYTYTNPPAEVWRWSVKKRSLARAFQLQAQIEKLKTDRGEGVNKGAQSLFQMVEIHHDLTHSPTLTLYPDSNVLLPEEQTFEARHFNRVVADMRMLAIHGKSIAVIANDDTAYYLAANVPPWNKYSPLLPNLVTKTQLATVQQQLANKTVDYVYVTSQDASETFVSWFPLTTTDAWKTLRATVRAHYVFDHSCGMFEVYHR